MWTTAGRTLSATVTNAAWRASAVFNGWATDGSGPRLVVQIAWTQNPAPILAKTTARATRPRADLSVIEIGRASCRERVESAVDGVSCKKKSGVRHEEI